MIQPHSETSSRSILADDVMFAVIVIHQCINNSKVKDVVVVAIVVVGLLFSYFLTKCFIIKPIFLPSEKGESACVIHW